MKEISTLEKPRQAFRGFLTLQLHAAERQTRESSHTSSSTAAIMEFINSSALPGYPVEAVCAHQL